MMARGEGAKAKRNEKVGPPTAGNPGAPAPYTKGASASR